MITKMLATTAVISFSLTATAFAQDKSADKPKPSATDSQAKIGGNDPIPGIDIIIKEAPEKASARGADGEDRIMENVTAKESADGLGAIVAIGAVKDTGGEDRLTENVTLNYGVKEAPACVTESGAADADCNGAPDAAAVGGKPPPRITRPVPIQQRR